MSQHRQTEISRNGSVQQASHGYTAQKCKDTDFLNATDNAII